MADENGGGGEKSQAPTEKRLQTARDEGNVAQSREFMLLITLSGFTLVFSTYVVSAAPSFISSMKVCLNNFGNINSDPASLYKATISAGLNGLKLAAPLLITGAALPLIFGLLQTNFLFRPQALTPDISRISPMKGVKKIFGINNLVELIKSLLKLIIFCLILYGVAKSTVRLSPEAERWSSQRLAQEMKSWFVYSVLLVLAVQCVITIFDDLWTRFHRISKLKMSLQDIKDEMKQTEGDPLIKAKIRQIALRRSRRRMMDNVKKSTVVVVNPTHYSVAILYDKNSSSAPQVVAKGVDDLAFRIREIANNANVPIISNPPLARSLYNLPLDTEIPEEFWKPVAAIIAYLVKLKTPGSRRNSL
ncbi:flagellar biosynthesis protein FlhB [Acetobacter pomorum]|uniref:Flagellar biosynthesis protein FlhB n=1 Tax=Acetobacter pomorum TaxID=65959 RepID=A0A2G4R8K4_9PROT|nr:EscU/YscU/HrcU family type III secretion system export apparatus switch protein [Acetobacter pomorum]PHY92884.1 flagellar biosynthesis protein FlhB [Acetobacter pomorum]